MNIKCALLAVSILSALPAAARAEAPPPPVCTAAYEAIVTLNPPVFDTATIWDARLGAKDVQIRFSGGVALENGDVLAAGDVGDVDFKPLQTTLAEADKRSHIVADGRMKAAPGEKIAGLIQLADGGFITASTVLTGNKADERAARLVRYDRDRHFKSDVILKDTVFDYEAVGLIPAAGGNAATVIVHAVNRKDAHDEYGILFRIDGRGKVVWKRAYRPGVANQLYGITAIDKQHMLATGRIKNEDGRMAGWMMELNDDGTIVWQNIYPRGQTAILRAAALWPAPPGMGSDEILAAGQIVPYGEDPAAAWLMAIDSTGAVTWQRYLRTADYSLDGRAVQVESDGRITLMANAAVKRADGDGSDHIRLFTLTPRGEVMNDEAYMQGISAEAAQLIPGRSRERIVVGTVDADIGGNKKTVLITDAMVVKQMAEAAMASAASSPSDSPAAAATPSSPEKTATEIPDIMRDQGWIFAATALPPWNDPCAVHHDKAAP